MYGLPSPRLDTSRPSPVETTVSSPIWAVRFSHASVQGRPISARRRPLRQLPPSATPALHCAALAHVSPSPAHHRAPSPSPTRRRVPHSLYALALHRAALALHRAALAAAPSRRGHSKSPPPPAQPPFRLSDWPSITVGRGRRSGREKPTKELLDHSSELSPPTFIGARPFFPFSAPWICSLFLAFSHPVCVCVISSYGESPVLIYLLLGHAYVTVTQFFLPFMFLFLGLPFLTVPHAEKKSLSGPRRTWVYGRVYLVKQGHPRKRKWI